MANQPITRELLRAFCAQYPSQVLSREFEELEHEIEDNVKSETYDAQGELRDELLREVPHKIDENLWRNREMCEQIVLITDPEGAIAKV